MGVLYSVFGAIFGGGGSGGEDDGEADPATGLTMREKHAITASWALIADKKAIKKNGVDFFVMLFTEHPYMQDKFDYFKGKEISAFRKDKVMASHALTVMYSIGNLVENLDDADTLVLLANKLASSHLHRDIGYRYFQDLAAMFPDYLRAQAGSAATPLVTSSWSKFLGVLNSLVKAMEDEQKGDVTTVGGKDGEGEANHENHKAHTST